jgi:hypothetical protein
LWGDKKTENRKGKPMRSILTLTLAGLIAATTLAPAFAATKHKHKAAPVQSEENFGDAWQQSPAAARPAVPGVVYQQPYACFTDEGYGRYTPCDTGGGM